MNKAKGPRLWLKPAYRARTDGRRREAKWFIRDNNGYAASTGFSEHQLADAEAALAEYIYNKAPESARTFYVYFVSAKAEGFPIKIGFTSDAKTRFSGLQVSLPYELDILGVFEVTDPLAERRFHKKFDRLRLRGEWFKRHPELLEFIDKLKASAAA